MTKFLICAALIAAVLFETGSNFLAKQAAIFTATFLALICISSPLMAAEASPEPAGFDILGMKLGMSVAEIETAIKAHNPQLNISMDEIGTDYRLGIGKFVQRVGAALPHLEQIFVVFTVTEPRRAFYIQRDTTFPQQQPFMDEMVQQLRGKYGPESRNTTLGASFVKLDWGFDKAGEQLSPKYSNHLFPQNACSGPISYGSPTVPRFSPECGINLAVILNASYPNNHLLLELHEQLVGDAIAMDDIQKLMAEAKAVQERQRQQQEQRASAAKVPL